MRNLPDDIAALRALILATIAERDATLVERDILVRALEHHRFNRTAAGIGLGLSLRQMRYRMARLNVNVGGDPAGADRE